MLKNNGVKFSKGLLQDEIDEIEKIYEIKFPKSLCEFYKQGFPVSADDNRFPQWMNFSDENISKIKKRIYAPYEWLLKYVKIGFWVPQWGETKESNDEKIQKYLEIITDAPKLIPLYSHRYMPVLDGVDNPPVISTVGRDTIIYGGNLYEYLRNEFGNRGDFFVKQNHINIPFWSDVIKANYN